MDCDDSNPRAFPGAAPNDSFTDCMLDADRLMVMATVRRVHGLFLQEPIVMMAMRMFILVGLIHR